MGRGGVSRPERAILAYVLSLSAIFYNGNVCFVALEAPFIFFSGFLFPCFASVSSV